MPILRDVNRYRDFDRSLLTANRTAPKCEDREPNRTKWGDRYPFGF